MAMGACHGAGSLGPHVPADSVLCQYGNSASLVFWLKSYEIFIFSVRELFTYL